MTQTKPIDIVPYNPQWPQIFEIQAHIIQEALGRHYIALHHIGSTSVPGLAAKPIIDIIGVVTNPVDVIDCLEKIGMRYKGEYNIPGHYGFSKRGEIDINLHVYAENHPEIALNLAFRDYLRKNPSARDEYGALKKNLLADGSAGQRNNSAFTNYTLRKGDCIRKILTHAGFDRIRILKCNDETEWAAAKNFRTQYNCQYNCGYDNSSCQTKEALIEIYPHPAHQHFILYQGAKIIGYAHIQLHVDESAVFHIMIIDETKRNNGFGRAFLYHCEQWLKTKGYQSLYAYATPDSEVFFEKNGYIHKAMGSADGTGNGTHNHVKNRPMTKKMATKL